MLAQSCDQALSFLEEDWRLLDFDPTFRRLQMLGLHRTLLSDDAIGPNINPTRLPGSALRRERLRDGHGATNDRHAQWDDDLEMRAGEPL